MSYVPDLTVDELATWIEKNQHKFVFLVYHGGGGGEHICNYLSQQPNLFYKTLDDKGINKVDDGNRSRYENGSALARSIQTPLLFLEMANEDQLNGIVGFDPKERNSITFKQLAELILKYDLIDKNATITEEPGLDSIHGWHRPPTKKDLDEIDQQDLPMLFRSHNCINYHHLFKDSRIIFQYSRNYQEYIRVLGMLKHQIVLTTSHGLNETLVASVPKEELTQTVINSIVYASWQEDIYGHHLNDKIWLLEYNSHFLDYIRYLNYNIRFVTFEECFTGDWVTKEFGIDSIAFNNAMIQWDKNNTKFIKGLNTPPLLFRCPNQELYNDTD